MAFRWRADSGPRIHARFFKKQPRYMTHLVSSVQSRFGPRSYFKIFGSRNLIGIFHFQKIFRPSGVALQKTLTVPHLPHFRDSTLGMQPIRRPLPVQPVIQTDHQRTIQSMFFATLVHRYMVL